MSSQPPSTDNPRTIYKVGELNATVRELLGQSFPLLWVEGEISNLAQPRSGHWYFTLKDSNAQVRCAMFRNKNRLVRQPPDNGDQILVRAKVGLYAQRGDYQLIVEHLEDAGDGALQRAFEQLKKQLAAEGLFSDADKRPLPTLPRRIGVITSATGAALRDVLSVLQRRFPLGRVLLHPVPVQGQAAAPAIVKAFDTLGSHHGCDVILLVRGGGSLEDLWAFNEESVARAIRACPVPVISGVGHEVDFTIADFVADLRAPTPSAAAESVCPDQRVWVTRLAEHRQRLAQVVQRHLNTAQTRVVSVNGRLQRMHPQRDLQQRMQRLDEIELRLQRGARRLLEQRDQKLVSAVSTLHHHDPRRQITRADEQCRALQQRLARSIHQQLGQARHRWQLGSGALNTVSPLATLDRGYAIARDQAGRVMTRADAVAKGDTVQVTLRHGQLDCEVMDRAVPVQTGVQPE